MEAGSGWRINREAGHELRHRREYHAAVQSSSPGECGRGHLGEGSPSPPFRSLVMQLSPLSPGRDWPPESEDASKTSARSTVQMIQVLLFVQMMAPEPDRDSD